MSEIGRGTVSSLMGRGSCGVDLVPVDIVCRTILVAPWAKSFSKLNEISVYNCTSGQINPITWQELGDFIVTHARDYPSKYLMLYPEFSYRTVRLIHWFYVIFLQFLPAILFDILLRVQGKPPMMLKLAQRMRLASNTTEFFIMNEWNFNSKNFRELLKTAKDNLTDFEEFSFDMEQMNWDDTIRENMLGIRQFILNDEMKSLPGARRKLKM